MKFSSSTDPRFYALLNELSDLHVQKSEDYGTGDDPLANLRVVASCGWPTWMGVLIRMEEKMFKIRQLAQRSRLANESVHDSLMDLANYALLCVILLEEEGKENL